MNRLPRGKQIQEIHWDSYSVNGKIYHLPRFEVPFYDMIFRYVRSVCFANKQYSSRTIQYGDGRSYEMYWIYLYNVITPIEDTFLMELIEKVDHNELWTNMVFMDKFRERLIYYGLYYESK